MDKKKTPLIYKLFNQMDDYEKRRFMRRFGLFQCTFLDLDFENSVKNIDKTISYDVDHPHTKKMLINLERFINNSNRVLVIDCNTLKDRIVTQYDGVYDVVDTNDQLKVLVQADADPKQQIIYLQQRKEQGFCDSDLYSIDFVLVKNVIPKLLEAYKDKTKYLPDGLTKEEWNKILNEILWLCNEYVTEFKNDDNSEDYQKHLTQAKSVFVYSFMKLL